MPRLAWTARLSAYLLTVVGIALLVTAFATGERANASGFVPGMALGFLAAAVATLTLIAADHVRDGQYGRVAVALRVGLVAWLIASTFAVVWGFPTALPWASPLRGIVAGVVLIGFVITLYLGSVVPVFWALAWLADRIPALRRSNVGKEIRRQVRGQF